MKVLICGVPGSWYPESRKSVWKYWRRPNETEFVLIDPKNERHYEEILTEHWAAGEDFAVVEPDIVIREDVARAFRECKCEYGAFPYAWTTDIGPALGCTWFRAGFLEKYPNALNEVSKKNVSWRQLDTVLMRWILARDYGEQPHVHLPPVKHLNPTKQLLPNASTEPLMSVPLW